MSIKIKKQSALMMIMVIGMCLYYALKNSFIYLEIFKLLLLIANLCGIVLIIGNQKNETATVRNSYRNFNILLYFIE